MKSMIRLMGLLATLMISGTSLHAQGFAGKRFILNYDFAVFHALQHNYFSKTGEPRELSLLRSWNKTHLFELDYVLNRSHVVGATYLRFRTNEGIEGTQDLLNLYAQGYGVYYKRFLGKKGAIAPIGSWWKFQVTQMHYRAVEILNRDNTGTAENYDFRFAFGRQTVLVSRVLFNLGIEFANPLPWGWERARLEPAGFYGMRLDYHNAINVKIGLALPIY
jgi:hypothetical protein